MTTSSPLCACGRAARHRGAWCHACYERARRKGDLELLPRETAWAKFLQRREIMPDGCWLWTGAVHKTGYGLFNPGEGVVRAHRWSYEHYRGPIPNGLHIDHLCRVRRCVNPDHLEAVTQAENNRRSFAARGLLGVCGQGHPRREYQHCPECRREAHARRAVDPAWRAARAEYERARRAHRDGAA